MRSFSSLGRATLAVIAAAFVLFPTLSYAGSIDSNFYSLDEDSIFYCNDEDAEAIYIFPGTYLTSGGGSSLPGIYATSTLGCYDIPIEDISSSAGIFTIVAVGAIQDDTFCDINSAFSDLNGCVNTNGTPPGYNTYLTSFGLLDSNPFAMNNFSPPDDFPLTNGVGIAMLSISPLSMILFSRKKTRAKVITRFGKVVNYVSSKYDKAIDAMFKRRTY